MLTHLQRAALVILLVGMMIAPFGICLQYGSGNGHDCCMQMQSSSSLHGNCCAFRTQVPAILSSPTMVDPGLRGTSHELLTLVEDSAKGGRSAVAFMSPPSPPSGAFMLRI